MHLFLIIGYDMTYYEKNYPQSEVIRTITGPSRDVVCVLLPDDVESPPMVGTKCVHLLILPLSAIGWPLRHACTCTCMYSYIMLVFRSPATPS